MNIDWEAEWDNLGNDDGESRAAEKSLAESTQKIVRKFRKWWDRYLHALYNTSFVRCHFTQIQYGGIIQTLQTNSCRRSQPSGTKGYQVVPGFSFEVFSENGEAQASSIFGLFVLQTIANGLPTGHTIYCVGAKSGQE